ncbi:sensor histidine kinase [Microvirga puerhi]|uniref:Blue-light-activated histidine kinase n=1 Tax=Microvirga puerhi TaxID=2876078 RepID=A0ABS7VJU4_9HYPH|nr:HWE histidine kinase domain-containing protein [Microvirga puerhi]MBZ6075799.1 PAS domain-containing protein [Microvirga puerhi]
MNALRGMMRERRSATDAGTSVRQLLWGLVLALAIPTVLVTSAGIYSVYRAEREATDLRLRETTRALALSLDLEIEKAEAALRILAVSPHIESENFAAFHDQLVRTPLPNAIWIALFEPNGRTVVTSRRPFGESLPDSLRPETLRRVGETGRAELSDLVVGPVTGQPIVTLDVPIKVGDKVAYILGMAIDPAVFQKLITDQRIAENWRAAVVDRSGRIVARSFAPETFVGQTIRPELLQAITTSQEGDIESTALDGLPVRSYFTRSSDYGWSFVIGYPKAEVFAALSRALIWLLVLGTVILTGFIQAALLSRSIARPVQRLVAIARNLGKGQRIVASPMHVLEFDTIQTALAEAASSIANQAQEREDALERIAESEVRLRLALNAGDLGSWEYDPEAGNLNTSATSRRIFGRDSNLPFSYRDLLDAIHPDDREKQTAAVHDALLSRSDLHVEFRAIWPDESVHWVRVSGRTRTEPSGNVTLVGVCQDVTARKLADERQALLLHELNHRVKNTLATVQSIASLTRRSAEAGDPAVWDAFLGRLQGLANTNDLLTATNWNGAYLEDVLCNELEPYQDALKRRIKLRGPRVSLQANAVLALGLAVHELATNAAKYGGLSRPDGRVLVTWAVTKGSSPRSLLVEWVETGGPPVVSPQRQGFGSKLIQRGLAQQLGGEIKLTFATSGVRCVITFPVAGIVAELDEPTEADDRELAAS